jgi:predicted kinase
MEMVMLIGIQGAGKSTFYCERFFATHVRLNLDMLRTRRRLDALVRACLDCGQRFVLDNTHSTKAERAPYLAMARAAHFRVVGYFFTPDLAESLRRNAGRSGRARIPAKGVAATYRKLEPPSYAEGFDELWNVRLTDTGEFVVEPFDTDA